MANATIAQSISRHHVGQALRQMRLECQYNPRELTAINKAALNLEACLWQYDGEYLVIESASQLGKRYHVDHAVCDCQAAAHGKPCWHLAAWHLVRRGAEVALTPPAPQKAYAEVVAAANADLF
jgi:hypothetical protein